MGVQTLELWGSLRATEEEQLVVSRFIYDIATKDNAAFTHARKYLSKIVKCLRAGGSLGKRAAAQMVHRLATISDESRSELLQLGVVHPLVELLETVRNSCIFAIFHTCRAMWRTRSALDTVS